MYIILTNEICLRIIFLGEKGLSHSQFAQRLNIHHSVVMQIFRQCKN